MKSNLNNARYCLPNRLHFFRCTLNFRQFYHPKLRQKFYQTVLSSQIESLCFTGFPDHGSFSIDYAHIYLSMYTTKSFILSCFNYCPLVWYFSAAKQVQKVDKNHERVVCFIHDDYHSDSSGLSLKTNSSTMEVRRMRALCVEIYKTLNNLDPDYIKDIFVKPDGRHSSSRPLNISVPRVRKTTFGLRCRVDWGLLKQ